MKQQVVHISEKRVIVYHSNGESFDDLGEIDHIPKSLLSAQPSIIVLDYDTYLDLDLRKSVLGRVDKFLQIEENNIFSPHEVIAALVKKEYPQVNGRINVVDVAERQIFLYIFELDNGHYKYISESNLTQVVGLKDLFEQYLDADFSKLVDFDLFLKSVSNRKNESNFETLLVDKLIALEKGQSNDYGDELFRFSKNDLWKEVLVSNIQKLRTEIKLKISKYDNVLFTGLLSGILNLKYNLSLTYPRIFGAKIFFSAMNDFYDELHTNIAVNLYCYPSTKNIILFSRGDKKDVYTKPKQIKLFNTGSLSISSSNELIPLEFRKNVPHVEFINVVVKLDGNQNLILTSDNTQKLIKLYE